MLGILSSCQSNPSLIHHCGLPSAHETRPFPTNSGFTVSLWIRKFVRGASSKRCFCSGRIGPFTQYQFQSTSILVLCLDILKIPHGRSFAFIAAPRCSAEQVGGHGRAGRRWHRLPRHTFWTLPAGLVCPLCTTSCCSLRSSPQRLRHREAHSLPTRSGSLASAAIIACVLALFPLRPCPAFLTVWGFFVHAAWGSLCTPGKIAGARRRR
jgi:hypothetical protein